MTTDSELSAYGRRFAELYDVIRGYRDAAGEVDVLQAVFGRSLDKGATILDLGCGTGLHAVELAKRGYKVTGIDLSADMIAVAQQKKSDVTFLCGSLAEHKELGPFDGCMSLGNVINCLDNMDSLCAFFESVAAVLKPKSRFICECWNPIAVIKTPPTRVVRNYESKAGKIARVALPKWDFMKQELEIDYDIEITPPKNSAPAARYRINHHLCLFTPLEIEFCLKRAGFEQIEIRSGLPEFQTAGEDDRMLAVNCLKS